MLLTSSGKYYISLVGSADQCQVEFEGGCIVLLTALLFTSVGKYHFIWSALLTIVKSNLKEMALRTHGIRKVSYFFGRSADHCQI